MKYIIPDELIFGLHQGEDINTWHIYGNGGQEGLPKRKGTDTT
jgi:hypothetical protein